MMNCTDCIHSSVCKMIVHRTRLLTDVNRVLEENDYGQGFDDHPFTIEIGCQHFEPKKGVIRK